MASDGAVFPEESNVALASRHLANEVWRKMGTYDLSPVFNRVVQQLFKEEYIRTNAD